MKTPFIEENYVLIKQELSSGITGVTRYWYHRFLRNNIKVTMEEVGSMVDLWLLMSIRKFRSGKWTNTTTKCKPESFFYTHANCMALCFLDKHCGIYGKRKDGTKYVKNRERIPEQYIGSLTDTFVNKIEGAIEEKRGSEKVQIIKSPDRDPIDMLIAKDLLEKLIQKKPKYGLFLQKLMETESVEETAKFFGRRVQTVHAKIHRVRKHLNKLIEEKKFLVR